MQVAVLVLNGVFDSGLAVLLDTLETANALAESNRKWKGGPSVVVALISRQDDLKINY